MPTTYDAIVIGSGLAGLSAAFEVAVVRHPSEFYLLEPGSEARRPRQRTTIPGLALAGDYTKQPFICSNGGRRRLRPTRRRVTAGRSEMTRLCDTLRAVASR